MNHLVRPTIQTIALDIEQFCAAHAMEWPYVESPKVDVQRDILAMRQIVRMVVNLPVQKLPEIRYPASWREALKERFAPAWVLKRWPVRYIVWDVKVVYQDIALPKNRHFIHVHRCSFDSDFAA